MRGKFKTVKGETQYFLYGGGTAGWVRVSKAEYDAMFPDKPILAGSKVLTSTQWGKPILSDGAAVHPDDIPQAEKDAERHGVPTQFVKEDGRPIFTSRDHRKRYLQSIGMHDRQGGYSDG